MSRADLNARLEARQQAEFGGKKCFKCGERDAEIGPECILCAMARPARWPGSVEADRLRVQETTNDR